MVSEIEVLRIWLSGADFKTIVDYAGFHKRTLSFLTALTYDQESLISWRAVEALGLAASRIAVGDQEYVRGHLRRLFWMLTDESGSIGWRAPESIGEILRQQPDLFEEFIPILLNLMDAEPEDTLRFRAGWLWAMGRLAMVRPDEVRAAFSWITSSLDDSDPQIRGMAVWCIGEMEYPLPAERVRDLLSDQEKVKLYFSPDIKTIRIGDLARSLVIQT